GLPELPNVGVELQLAGRLAALRHPYDDFARDRGAHGTLLVSTSTLTGRTRGGLSGKLDGIRARAERALDAGLPATEGGLLRGMLLAEEGRVSEEVRSDFTRTGMRYLLAADGRKVMLLGALALPLLAAAGFSRGSRLLAVGALIAIYVPVAGARPSAQRAGVMGGAALFAGLAGRAGSRWYALLLAAAVTLTLQPRAAADAGWQLSFAAVATILVLAEPLRRRLIARGLPRAVADSSALTLAATLGVTPLLALHFDQVSLASLPANLLAAPAVAPVVWVGMLSATVGQVLPLGSTLLNGLNLVPLVYIEWIAHVAARLPGASVHAGGPVVAAALAGGPLLGFVLWRVLRRRLPVTRRRPPRLSRR
ncbi:MAG TPA: ComEC/Rec2 family competence protein, partial [Solirubrobacteraceae bacterium]|nr:ComEC/Rec2 family competence protein [Solirubrobacteraceae bacterium]